MSSILQHPQSSYLMLAFCKWLPAIVIATASTVVVPVLAARPLDPASAAGIFPPWWSPARALVAASEAGSVVRVGAFAFIVVIRTEGGDAATSLRRQGAWFSIDPQNAFLCITR